MSEVKPWKTLQSETVFESDFLKLRKETCQLPDGMINQEYLIVDMQDSAVVVCITKEQQVVLVKQYRHAAGEITLELPAGHHSRHDMNITESARRELMEETGYAADKMDKIAEFEVDPTTTKATVHVYVASDAEKVSVPVGRPHEVIETELVSLEEVEKMVADGRIKALSQVAALRAFFEHRKND